MSEEIKPCPFCGSNEIYCNDEYLYSFVCQNCYSSSGKRTTHLEAIKAWNQRPYDYDMPAIVKKVQQLEEDLQEALFALKAWCFMFPDGVSKLDKDILEKHNLIEVSECKQPE